MLRAVSFVFLLLSLNVQAEEIQVLKFTSSGRKCSGDDVQLIQNGNAFSILFNRFGIELAEGNRADGRFEAQVCYVAIDMKVPQNSCLQQLDQVFRGGIVKSARSRGSLYISYGLHSLFGHAIKQWRLNDPIEPEDEDSLFSIDFSKRARQCIRGRVRYHALVIMEGQRASYVNDHFLANLDSNDAEVTLRLR